MDNRAGYKEQLDGAQREGWLTDTTHASVLLQAFQGTIEKEQDCYSHSKELEEHYYESGILHKTLLRNESHT